MECAASVGSFCVSIIFKDMVATARYHDGSTMVSDWTNPDFIAPAEFAGMRGAGGGRFIVVPSTVPSAPTT